MDEELQNILFEKYPDLFSNRTKSPKESCMSWGCDIGNGWYDLLSSVCWRISQHEEYIKTRKKYKLTDAEEEYYPVKFDQVKEKYGGLRIYYSGGDDYVEGAISMAEEMSYKICEICGNSGKPNKGGWITTLCNSCRNKDERWIPPEFPG
jgi:hypothetical protein